MVVSLYRLRADAATGPRERALHERRRQRRARIDDRRARVRERRGGELGGVDPPEPERAAAEVEEHDVRLAARAEALAERQARPALEAGGDERAAPEGLGDARAALVGVAAAAARAREDESGVGHARQRRCARKRAPARAKTVRQRGTMSGVTRSFMVNHRLMPELETMRLAVAGPVARVTLDRPAVLNAGDARWVRDLNRVVGELAERPEVRVVVLTGAGRAFSTGVDLKALASGAFGLGDFVAWEDAMTAMERMDKLFIAGIRGHCLGGGLQLALVCDYRLASDDPLLGLPAVKECLIPSMSLYRLPRLVGLARAKELCLLGEPIPAREAERYGLVNRVVPAADFPRQLEATLERFLALPPASVRASKRLLTRAFDLEFDAFRKEMEMLFADCLASGEHRRAMDAIRARMTRGGPEGVSG